MSKTINFIVKKQQEQEKQFLMQRGGTHNTSPSIPKLLQIKSEKYEKLILIFLQTTIRSCDFNRI